MATLILGTVGRIVAGPFGAMVGTLVAIAAPDAYRL